MNEYFKDALALFSGFKSYLREQDDKYTELANSGKYSTRYMADLQAQNLIDRHAEQSITTSRLSKIREKYAEHLEKVYDLEQAKPSDNLRTVLNSGVRLTENDLLRLARKHQGNLVDSRLLCDYARDHGYELRNYVSEEDALKAFDDFSRQLAISISNDDPFVQPYQSEDQAWIGAEAYSKRSEQPPMDISPVPQTVEQAIYQDMKREQEQDEEQKLSPERIAAFLEGFRGELEPEPTPVDDLTHQEKQLAEFAATRHNGTITPEDVELAKRVVKETLDARPTEQEQETEK